MNNVGVGRVKGVQMGTQVSQVISGQTDGNRVLKSVEKCQNLPPVRTAEQMTAIRAANAEKRAANRLKLRRDFADSNEWDELARARGIRLPLWTLAPTPANMRKWLRKVGWTGVRYIEGYSDDLLVRLGQIGAARAQADAEYRAYLAEKLTAPEHSRGCERCGTMCLEHTGVYCAVCERYICPACQHRFDGQVVCYECLVGLVDGQLPAESLEDPE